MSAIPIGPPQEDELEDILRRTGAHAIPTGQVAGGASPAAIPTAPDASQAIPTDTGLPESHPLHKQAGVASLWTKASNINNPVLRVLGKIGAGLARGIDVVGSVAAPGIAANIPGSTLNTRINENRDRRQASEDTVNQERQAVTQHTQQETAQAPQELEIKDREQTSREQAADQKPDASVSLQAMHAAAVQEAIAHGQDPSQSPKVQQLADAITSLQKQTAPHEASPELQAFDASVKGGLKPMDAYRKLHPEKPQSEPGSYMPLYDEHGRVTGAWNAKTGHVQQAPQNLPGTTSAGAGIQSKATAATEKEAAPYKQMIDSAQEAHQLAQMAAAGNAEADVDLALSFFKMMKGTGGSGVRFTKQEQEMILGARSAGQGLEAVAQKVFGEGQAFTPAQRKNVVDIIDMHANAAKHHLEGAGGGGAEPSSGGKATENDPLGIR